MKRFVVVAFAVACLAAGSAQARQAPPAAAAAAPAKAAPSPRALALTKRYIAALHVDETMKPLMQSMMTPLMEEQERTNTDLTAEQRKALRETVEELVGGDLMNDVIDRMTPVYASIFSEDELQALVDFYESPNGQSIVRKMPSMGPAMAEVMRDIMPEIRAKVTARICQKLGCGATAPVKKPVHS